MDNTYRVSQRVFLNSGDVIKLAGGPYYQCGSGRKVPMGVRGRVTFVGYGVDGVGNELLYVRKDGHVEAAVIKRIGESEVVYKPYRITKERKSADQGPKKRARYCGTSISTAARSSWRKEPTARSATRRTRSSVTAAR